MALTSGIYKRYKKLFLLDDDGLRRIEGVLRKAVLENPENLSIVFHVRREDDRFYETENVDEVLSDPNIIGKRVKLLAIEIRKAAAADREVNDHERVVWVVFDKDEPPIPRPEVVLRISSPDRTWALMLADAIEPQIVRLFKVKTFPNWVFFLFAPVASLVGYRVTTARGLTQAECMNYALWSGVAFLAIVLTLMTHTRVAERTLKPLQIFASEPVFHWGEEVAATSDRAALRKNIFWVVIVGFIVSVLAGAVPLLF